MAKVKKETISSENEIGKLIKIVVILLVLFFAFYLLTVFINKEDEPEETNTPATIQYDRILIGNILVQPNDEYYVLVEGNDEDNVALYELYLGSYESTDDAIRVYYATLELPYNEKFIGEETITNITNIDDLRLKGTTLLKIKNGKITQTLDTADNIKSHLKDLAGIEETE